MKRVFAVGLLVLLVASVVLVALLAARKPVAPWFSVVSKGNGYDALVQAASLMNGRMSDDKAEAAAFVKANERMFELVDSALQLPFEVPSMMYSVTNSLLNDLSSFKTIALALRTRGKEAEQRGANGEAATNYASIIQLGQRVEHGPVIALLVGIAIEKIGLDALEKVAIGLTPAQRKEVADKIEALDRERLPFAEVILREEHYAHQVAGNPLKLLVARFYVRSGLMKTEQKQQKLSSDFQRVAKELRSNAR
jgi:hypothetical protein